MQAKIYVHSIRYLTNFSKKLIFYDIDKNEIKTMIFRVTFDVNKMKY